MAITAEAATTSIDPFEQFRAGRLDTEVARVRVEELFSAHRRKVEHICRALLRDRHESEDAAQQTFLSAFRALRNGAVPREAEAWLGSIARNECLARIRDRMREPLSTLMFELEDGNTDVHRQATSNMNAAHLWQEIQSLPDHQRDAIVLREFAGLSYDELAVALGVSGAAVESLLFRARGTLRRRLQTALASVNVAGAATGAASALARIFAGGVAPIATKAAAIGAGTVVLGGGWFAGSGALTLPKASPRHAAVVRKTVAPAPVTVAATHVPVAATHVHIVPASSRTMDSDGERSGKRATISTGDAGRGDGSEESGRATRVAITVSSAPLAISTSASGKDGGGDGDGDGGGATARGNDGESGSFRDGNIRVTSDAGD